MDLMTYVYIALGVVLVLLVLLRKKLAPYFRFLFTRIFILNFIAALIVAGVAFWGLLAYLDNYTLHGEKIAVPNFYGMHVTELDAFTSEKNLRYQINDSIYSDDLARGTVIKQDPSPHAEGVESFVKPDRTIYLTVVKSGIEYKTLPELKDKSKDLAVSLLKIAGLKPQIKPVPGQHANLVYGSFYNGKETKKGQKVPKGSKIVLNVGKGTDGVPTAVPNLRGKTIDEAKIALSSYSLFLAPVYEDCLTAADSINAKIYKQVPGPVTAENSTVRTGSDLIVYASVKERNTSAPPDTTGRQIDTTRGPSDNP